jgi:hypothetical protein
LAKSQQEIHAATAEFTEALRQRVGTVPPLEQALSEMQGAVDALRAGQLVAGQSQEESALASLIEARQNLRQILRMSSSSQASQCRQVDRQQKQKLRPPKQEQKPEEQQSQQQLAQACQQLQQMADQQQQWSQQVCPSSQSSSGSPRQSSQEPTSRQDQVDRQQAAIQQAEQLKQQLEESQRAGELAEQRMDGATDAMRKAQDELGQNRAHDAADAAERAAERLRELARHLETLNEPDFGQRLAQACNQAQQLADRQQQVAANSARDSADEPEESTLSDAPPADQQRRLVENGEELDELMARLAAEALDQQAEVRRMIQDARDANPTDEIVELMRAAAEDFEADRDSQAVQSAELASRSLSQLADDLRKTRERYTQPDIEQLLAAEQRAAELLQKMMSGRNAGERALARSQLDELERALDQPAAGDERLAQALDALHDGTHRPSGHFERANDAEASVEAGLSHSDQVLVDGLRQVTDVLQTMIQEAILDRALLDPDDSVPPGYQKMVEEYYRALSEDLR